MNTARQAFYAVVTVMRLTGRWIKCKITGEPYDNGMDT